MDAQTVTESATSLARGQVKNPREFAGAVLFGVMSVVDLPLSLIADTLWLADDIRDIHANREKAEKAPVEPLPGTANKP